VPPSTVQPNTTDRMAAPMDSTNTGSGNQNSDRGNQPG
jgi:hypothetical protein